MSDDAIKRILLGLHTKYDIPQAAQQLRQYIETEIIGQDRYVHQIMTKELRQRGGEYANKLIHELQGENELRRIQRAKLREPME